MAIKRSFSDFHMDFIAHPATGDIVRKIDDASIIQSVKNLIMTNFYDRLFQPAIGSGVLGMLFENDTGLTRYLLKEQILNVISSLEPRVTIRSEDIEINIPASSNEIIVTISLNVVGMDKIISADINLKRIR